MVLDSKMPMEQKGKRHFNKNSKVSIFKKNAFPKSLFFQKLIKMNWLIYFTENLK